MIIGLAAACIFLLFGLCFVRGKGAVLLMRFHVVPEDDNGAYDPYAISRFIGFVSLLFSLGAFLWWLNKIFHVNLFLTLSLVIFIGTVLFVLVYLNTGERFWIPREDYVPFSSTLRSAEQAAAEQEASEHIETFFESVSVRGRVAYGAACLEKTVDALQARTPKMSEFLETLWGFTSAILFDEWEEKAKAFSVGSIEAFSKLFCLEGLEEPDLSFLYQVQKEALEAAFANLSGGQPGFTMEPTIRLVKLMWKNGFDLPSMKPFRLSSFSESSGWGDPRKPEFFQQEAN